MNHPKMKLGELFSLTALPGEIENQTAWNSFQSRLGAETKGIKWPTAMPDLLKKLCEILEIDVPNIFLESWKKAGDLQDLLRESEKTPEDLNYIEFAEHTISSVQNSSIEIRIGHVPMPKKLQFHVHLKFVIKGFVVGIKGGRITEIRTGVCELEGKLAFEDLPIAEKKLMLLKLPGSYVVEPIFALNESLRADK